MSATSTTMNQLMKFKIEQITKIPHPAYWTPEIIRRYELASSTICFLCYTLPGFKALWELNNAHITTLSKYIRTHKFQYETSAITVLLVTNKIRWYTVDHCSRTGKLLSPVEFYRLVDTVCNESHTTTQPQIKEE